tara:strand:+ start:484 stop:1053 length:570 start_codon:yes stop_codon:yes gene_type:complete
MSTLKVDEILKRTGTGTITIGQSGDTISIPSGATLNSAGTNTLTGIDNTPSFGAVSAANQTASYDANTKVVFGTEQWDSNSAFADSRFTVPSGEAGKYLFLTGVRFNAVASNKDIQLVFRKNGTQLDYGMSKIKSYISSGTATQSMIAHITLDLSASDYVEIYVYTSDSSGNVLPSGYAFFSGHKLLGV